MTMSYIYLEEDCSNGPSNQIHDQVGLRPCFPSTLYVELVSKYAYLITESLNLLPRARSWKPDLANQQP